MTTPLSYPNPDPDATASAVDIGPGSSDADLKKVTAEVPSVQAAPLTVPGYTVLDRLGRGGMAEVHLAEKIGTAGVPVRCVLKTILPEHSERERFQGRFLDEARIISQLRHPNIVSTVDVGVTDDKLYLAMEWVDGTDVAQLMMSCQKRKQEIPLRHILFILREALKGLHYAHTAPGADGEPLRIIHRDISPGNLLISRQGAVKLADFGVALGTPADRPGKKVRLAGKVHYFAPDLFRGDRQATPATDLFSMGICFYEMLTLRPMFSRKLKLYQLKDRLLRFDARSLLENELTVPDGLEEILLRALAAKPEDRYASALEFLEDVNDYVYEVGIRLLDAHFAKWIGDQLGAAERA
jgi:serine/threonine-protein kinase